METITYFLYTSSSRQSDQAKFKIVEGCCFFNVNKEMKNTVSDGAKYFIHYGSEYFL